MKKTPRVTGYFNDSQAAKLRLITGLSELDWKGELKIVPEKRLGEPESFPQDKDLILIMALTLNMPPSPSEL